LNEGQKLILAKLSNSASVPFLGMQNPYLLMKKFEGTITECVTDFDLQSEMIIFKSIFIILISSIVVEAAGAVV
jgi:hypothetical protein